MNAESSKRIVIFVPTYNEKENIIKLYADIEALNLSVDYLFLDDLETL